MQGIRDDQIWLWLHRPGMRASEKRPWADLDYGALSTERVWADKQMGPRSYNVRIWCPARLRERRRVVYGSVLGYFERISDRRGRSRVNSRHSARLGPAASHFPVRPALCCETPDLRSSRALREERFNESGTGPIFERISSNFCPLLRNPQPRIRQRRFRQSISVWRYQDFTGREHQRRRLIEILGWKQGRFPIRGHALSISSNQRVQEV
jgi:hypothetical protein